MGYRVKGTLKLPDGSPASNAEIEFISRKNFAPLVQELKSNILCGPSGAYDVTLEFGEYAVMAYPGGTYPAALGTITLASDTPAGQDLSTLLQQAGWQPATPEYIQQITRWLAEANASASAALASELAAKVSEVNAKESEVSAESDRVDVAAKSADVTTRHADVVAKAAQVSTDAAATQSAKNTAVSASTNAQSSATSAAGNAAKAEAAAVKAEQAAQTVVGALIDAGPYNASTGVLPTPVMSGSTKLSSIWKVTGNGTAGGIQLGVGDSLVYTARDNSYYKIDNTESVSKVNDKSGVVVLNADDVGAAPADVVATSALPFPDVWIPLNDSLRMLAGFGDEIKVGDYTVATQATLTRNSGATVINKSGKLVSAAINEARFEREGLLVEDRVTNILSTNCGIRTSQVHNTSVKNSDGSYSHTAKGTSTIICAPSRDMIAPATKYTASVYYSSSRTKLAKNGIKFQFAYANNWVNSPFVLVDTRTNTIKGKGGNIVNESIRIKGDLVILTMTTTSNEVVDPSGGSLDVYTYDADSGSSAAVTSTDGDVFTEHGFQLEASSISSSLIPTNGAAVTRAADKLTIPRLNNECAEWYSGSDQITPILTTDTIELVPPAGKLHLRNVRGFFTPLTTEQKAALK